MTALVLGIARRNIIELRRYAFNTFFEILGIYVLFLLLFYGVRGFGGAQVRDGDVLPALVIGYLVFGLVFMSYSSLASWVTQEATLGTVEQLAMSPYGLPAVLIAEYATSVIRQAVVVTCIAIAAQATTGQWLHLRPLTIAPLVCLLLLQQLGVALGLAGLALIFKRMVAVTGLVQFAFVALVGAPLSRYEWLRFFPVSLANDLIRRAAVADTPLLALPRGSLVLLVVLAVAYASIGIFVFTRRKPQRAPVVCSESTDHRAWKFVCVGLRAGHLGRSRASRGPRGCACGGSAVLPDRGHRNFGADTACR